MTEAELHQELNNFVKKILCRELSTEELFTFYVELQPTSGSFFGNLTNRGLEEPLDLRRVSKHEHSELMKKIFSFHRANTNHGRTKWNKATFQLSREQTTSEFTWDAECERMEREQAELLGSSRRKWHWE